MVLQQEDRLLGEDVAALPIGQRPAQTIRAFSNGNRVSIDRNHASIAADFVAIDADDMLDEGHIGGQIAAFFDKFSDALGHADEDVIATPDRLMIEPIEADWRTRRGVIDQLFRQGYGRCDDQSEHRDRRANERRTPHADTFFEAE